MSKYHEGLTFAMIMADDELRAVMQKHMPRAGKGMLFQRIKDVPIEQLLQHIRRRKRKEKLIALISELKQM